MRRKVVAAMSGGVDSSVAAALMLEEGCEVTGVTMRLFGGPDERGHSVSSAAAACRALGIPHEVVDLAGRFNESVIEYFLDEYVSGLTPNPCVRCNELIKFGELMDAAGRLGADALVTGHYARISREDSTGMLRLERAADGSRDQSYFLYRLTQAQLSRASFPIGGMTKIDVRKTARSLGLPNAQRPESREVCFIPDDDYRAFVRARRPEASKAGEFVDGSGKVVGTHNGVAFYTVGQRKGLGVSSSRGRLYVLERDAPANRITLGRGDELKISDCVLRDACFVSGAAPEEPFGAQVKLHYRSRPCPATIEPDGDVLRVRFDGPVAGVAPGQSAVFYDGDTVLGGGIVAGGAA